MNTYFLISAMLLPLNLSCLGSKNRSHVKDIFSEDEGNPITGNSRRRPATLTEASKIIWMKGCTAHFLTSRFAITAAHCGLNAGDIASTGASRANQNSDDLLVEHVIETNGKLDFTIFKYRLKNNISNTFETTRKIVVDQNLVTAGSSVGEGTEIYTVGYPADKNNSWDATFAMGRLKAVTNSNVLKYNIGVTNGNSGGPVWIISDNALLGLVTSGPSFTWSAGWDQNALDDASAWNSGTPAWVLAENSDFIKKVYPGGHYSEASENDLINGGYTPTGVGPLVKGFIPKNTKSIVCEPVGFDVILQLGFDYKTIENITISDSFGDISCNATDQIIRSWTFRSQTIDPDCDKHFSFSSSYSFGQKISGQIHKGIPANATIQPASGVPPANLVYIEKRKCKTGGLDFELKISAGSLSETISAKLTNPYIPFGLNFK